MTLDEVIYDWISYQGEEWIIDKLNQFEYCWYKKNGNRAMTFDKGSFCHSANPSTYGLRPALTLFFHGDNNDYESPYFNRYDNIIEQWCRNKIQEYEQRKSTEKSNKFLND